MLRCNKRAQTGEAITWVVATLVIIGILLIFTLVASLFAQANGAIVSLGRVFDSTELGEGKDWIGQKIEFAFKLDSSNKPEINSWVEK